MAVVDIIPLMAFSAMDLFQIIGDSWHQPSLFHHDSMQDLVSLREPAGITGDLSSWRGSALGHDGISQHSGVGTGNHRPGMAASTSRKNVPFGKATYRYQGEKKEDKVKELLFEEEGFPSLNPETGKQNQPCRPTGTPSRVWENPPST